MVIELRDLPAGAVDRLAATLGSVIRHEARETDRVTRVGPVRFHVLLPETSAAEADVLAGRIRDAALRKAGGPQPPTVIASTAAPRRGETLAAALARAIGALADGQETAERSTA